MTPEDRQRARDRAADAIAPREAVVMDRNSWAPTPARMPGASAARKRQFYRDRARAQGVAS